MEKKGFIGRLRSVNYMQASLGLFGLSLLLTLVLSVRAVMTNGGLTILEGFLGILALLLSGAGLVIALYGRFILKEKRKPDFRLGLLLNLLLMLCLVFLYFLGL